jgi:hypothetical protein
MMLHCNMRLSTNKYLINIYKQQCSIQERDNIMQGNQLWAHYISLNNKDATVYYIKKSERINEVINANDANVPKIIVKLELIKTIQLLRQYNIN